jgi:hypothetical protein
MEKICRWCKVEAQKVLGIPGDDRIWGLCAVCLRRELYLREQSGFFSSMRTSWS